MSNEDHVNNQIKRITEILESLANSGNAKVIANTEKELSNYKEMLADRKWIATTGVKQ